MGETRPLLIYFRAFSQKNDKYNSKFDYKNIDGELGIQTEDHWTVGADESTELRRSPSIA